MTTHAIPDSQTTVKQVELDMLHEDYWIAMDCLDNAKTPQEKRAYAVLAGLINALLLEFET